MEKLKKAPIVEAVLDIECDMPPGQTIIALEGPAREMYRDHYPKCHRILMHEHFIQTKQAEQPQVSSQESIQGFRFLSDDEKQIVQLRSQGFSFNRLAHYSTLDDYLPEMERTWKLFRTLATPVQVRAIRLRYINRILLPLSGGQLTLEDYFRVCPRLPDGEKMIFIGFLNQHSAVETDTGNQVNIILASQPNENNMAPVILDIAVVNPMPSDPANWNEILNKIQGLRQLKNRVFENTLTKRCLELFQE